jgi:hypothetical protein
MLVAYQQWRGNKSASSGAASSSSSNQGRRYKAPAKA